MRVLILCTGNSCRSQMAHGFLQSFDPRLEVYSGGTKIAPCINPQAVAVMQEVGVDISNHRPVSVNKYLHEPWDYVITVCGGAKENCPIFSGQVKHRLHMGFDDPSQVSGTSEFLTSEFHRVRDEIKAAFYALYLQHIKPQM